MDVVSGGVYRLASKLSGKRMDAAGGGGVDGTKVIQYAPNANDAQKWLITQEQDGSYKLQQLNTNQVLTARSNAVGTPLVTMADNGSIALAQQRWDIVRYSDGKYSFQHRGSKLMLDVAGASKDDGTQLITYTSTGGDAQRWNLELIDVVVRPGGSYTLLHKGTDQRLTVDGNSGNNGAPVYQWTVDDSNSQYWVITPDAAAPGYYNLRHRGTTKRLDVAGASANPMTKVIQWETSFNDAQRWKIVYMGDGHIKLVNKISGHCLAVLNNSSARQASVYVDTDNGSDAQRWVLNLTPYVGDGLREVLASGKQAAAGMADADRLMAYPNPAEGGQIRLSFVAQATGQVQLELYNSTGQRVRQQAQAVRAGVATQATLGAESLPAGLYTVRVAQAGAPAQSCAVAITQ